MCFLAGQWPLRFRTDPNEVGVEKIAATQVPPAFLEREYKECKALDSSPNLLRPFSVGYIKGYKRCSILLVTLDGIRELKLEGEIRQDVRAAWLCLACRAVLLICFCSTCSEPCALCWGSLIFLRIPMRLAGVFWHSPREFWDLSRCTHTSDGQPRRPILL